MNRTRYITAAKHITYSALFFALYIVQATPGLFEFSGAKPIWVIPCAIALAMFEGEFLGGVYGAAAGLLCDMGSFLLFGFNGFLTCVFCIAVGLLVIYLMRCNLASCFLFCAVFMMARGGLEFFFGYGMWGYDDAGMVFFSGTLPVAVFSAAITPAVYFTVKALHNKFKKLLG
ncbi:MAG: rod shape-determining protein MreD [Oscillospiraceae bacterium]|nr:rod shape-determining protein MreD [Oscillospiraceae bacterium]